MRDINWVEDNLNSEKPPPYFLQRLYDFDAMLVLMPSRQHPFPRPVPSTWTTWRE
jgi:hypothetical protein